MLNTNASPRIPSEFKEDYPPAINTSVALNGAITDSCRGLINKKSSSIISQEILVTLIEYKLSSLSISMLFK